MGMTKPKMLVIEDQGPRVRHFKEALKEFAEIRTKVTLDGLFREEAETIARYEAVLVDFDLQTEKNRFVAPAPILLLNPGSEDEIKVEATTGIGAMLHLRNVFASQEYREARKLHLGQEGGNLPPGWRPPPAHVAQQRDSPFTPRLFAFVGNDDPVSRLFASSCAAWFGAVYLDAHGNADYLKGALKNPTTHEQAALSRRIQKAGTYLTWMLKENFLGEARWLEPKPDGFQWLRIYHKSGGKQYSERTLKDAIVKVLGQPPTVYNLKHTGTQYSPVATLIQDAVFEYMKEWDEGLEEWPEWGGPRTTNLEDPVMDWLQRTETFWSAGDVEAAWLQHKRTLGAAP